MDEKQKKWHEEHHAIEKNNQQIADIEADSQDRKHRVEGLFAGIVRDRLRESESVKSLKQFSKVYGDQHAAEKNRLADEHRELARQLNPELTLEAQDDLQQQIRERALRIAGLDEEIEEAAAMGAEADADLRLMSSRKGNELPPTLTWEEAMAIYRRVRAEGDQEAEEGVVEGILNTLDTPQEKEALRRWAARAELNDRLEGAGAKAAEFLQDNLGVPISAKVLAEAVYGEKIKEEIDKGVYPADRIWAIYRSRACNLMRRKTQLSDEGPARRKLEKDNFEIGTYWRRLALREGDVTTVVGGRDTQDTSRRSWVVQEAGRDFQDEIFTQRGKDGNGFIDIRSMENDAEEPDEVADGEQFVDTADQVEDPTELVIEATDEDIEDDMPLERDRMEVISNAVRKAINHLDIALTDRALEDGEVLINTITTYKGNTLLNESTFDKLTKTGLIGKKESERIQRTHRIDLTKLVTALIMEDHEFKDVTLNRDLRKKDVTTLIERVIEDLKRRRQSE